MRLHAGIRTTGFEPARDGVEALIGLAARCGWIDRRALGLLIAHSVANRTRGVNGITAHNV